MAEKGLDRDEVLKDSEATLREVAGILLELWDHGSPTDEALPPENRNGVASPARLGELIGVLMKTYREINGVLDGIRRGRTILQGSAMNRVQRTHAKLEEVTLTTEAAATGMLDSLDRAHSLLDQLVPSDSQQSPDPKAQRLLGDELREELHGLISLLQFQDITAQQLAHASGVLAEVEERLEGLTRLFDLHRLDPHQDLLGLDAAEGIEEHGASFDPGASLENAGARQAIVDEIFLEPGGVPNR